MRLLNLYLINSTTKKKEKSTTKSSKVKRTTKSDNDLPNCINERIRELKLKKVKEKSLKHTKHASKTGQSCCKVKNSTSIQEAKSQNASKIHRKEKYLALPKTAQGKSSKLHRISSTSNGSLRKSSKKSKSSRKSVRKRITNKKEDRSKSGKNKIKKSPKHSLQSGSNQKIIETELHKPTKKDIHNKVAVVTPEMLPPPAAMRMKRRSSLMRTRWQTAYLDMARGEIADWLQHLLNIPDGAMIGPAYLGSRKDVVECLQTGKVLGALLRRIDKKFHINCKPAAKGSFMAKDNIVKFIAMCDKGLDIHRNQLFEVEDLTARKNEKMVINTLLDVARAAIKYGIEPPQLIKYEMEINKLKKKKQSDDDFEEEEINRDPNKPRWLPYIPKEGDSIDQAVAQRLNGFSLDIRVKRLSNGQYYIGKKQRLFLRRVRNVLLVSVGGGWEAFIPFTQRRIKEQNLKIANAQY